MNSNYQEFKPSAALQPFVNYYWLHTFEAESYEESPVQKCLPFGTLEVIIHLDDNHCHVLHNNVWQKLPHAFFVGLYRGTVQWKCIGASRKFGIQFKPESLLQLFNVPAASLFNSFTDLENVFGKEINRLVEHVYGLPTIQSVVAATETFLMAQLRNLRTERNYAHEATHLIRQSNGKVSIEALSEHLYISKRQLERSFKDTYGTTPKTYQRIIRFRSAYESFYRDNTTPNWIDISYNFGYSDQAHFIRDFKEFTDEVPTVLYHDTDQKFRIPSCRDIYAG